LAFGFRSKHAHFWRGHGKQEVNHAKNYQLNNITLDGAVENPHLWPSFSGGAGSDVSFDIQMSLLEECDTMLMGRRTYESFASVWPARSGDKMSDRFNAMQKIAVSTTLRDPSWNNTAVVRDLVEEIEKLKQQAGKNIVQYGLGQVSFTLMEHGLLDEIRLWVHPLILGSQGPQVPHFISCPATHLQLVDTKTLPNGIVILRYTVHKKSRG
jgi:dihydrofolate reductase